MRISDLSSDVCSSDLLVNTTTEDNQAYPAIAANFAGDFVVAWERPNIDDPRDIFGQLFAQPVEDDQPPYASTDELSDVVDFGAASHSSEERSVGKEGVSTATFRWTP